MNKVVQEEYKYDRYYTLIETDEDLKVLHEKLRGNIDLKGIRMLALAIGIKHMPDNYKSKVESATNKEKTRLYFDNFSEALTDSLIRQVNNISELDKTTKRNLYARYTEFGTNYIMKNFESYFDSSDLVIKLSEFILSNFTEDIKQSDLNLGNVSIIQINLGEDSDSNEVNIRFNDNKNAGYHMSITGTTGSGKTQLALNIASQIKKTSKNTNIIFFDYAKGDVAKNNKFKNDINAIVVDVGNDGIPFNPFKMENATPMKINEIASLIITNQRRIGPKQELELFNVLKTLYDDGDVDFYKVYDKLKENLELEGRSPDVLLHLFHQLSIPSIFPTFDESVVYESFLDDDIIFDLSKIDDSVEIKELVTFFVLHKIYHEAISLEDSPIDKDGNQQIRTIVFIDEGHNYLKKKNPILEKMLRELRSKGVGIIIMTQNYRDLIVEGFDYTTLMNWNLFMKQKISVQDLTKALGVSTNIAKSLPDFIDLSSHSMYLKAIRKKDSNVTYIQGQSYN